MNKSLMLLSTPVICLLAGCGGAGGDGGSTVDVTNIEITLKGDDAKIPLDLPLIPGGKIEMSRDSSVNKAGGRRLSASLSVEDKSRAEIIEFYTDALKKNGLEVEQQDYSSSSSLKGETDDGGYRVTVIEPRNGKSSVSVSSEYPDKKFKAPTLKAAAQ